MDVTLGNPVEEEKGSSKEEDAKHGEERPPAYGTLVPLPWTYYCTFQTKMHKRSKECVVIIKEDDIISFPNKTRIAKIERDKN